MKLSLFPTPPPDRSEKRLSSLLTRFSSIGLGYETACFLSTPHHQSNGVQNIFDHTMSDQTYATYYNRGKTITLNPSATDFQLIPAIEHEAAHHRQHQHNLYIDPIIASLQHILKHGLRSTEDIANCLLTTALPYLRMTELDAFGRQALYIHDYAAAAADGKAFFTAYLAKDSPQSFYDFMSAIVAVKQGITPYDTESLYATGFQTLDGHVAITYDLGHLRHLSFFLDRFLTYGANQTFNEDFFADIVTTHPAALYANRLADPVAHAVYQRPDIIALLDQKLYAPLHPILMDHFAEVINQVAQLAALYDRANAPFIIHDLNAVMLRPSQR